jgi:hypothetical protein
MADTYPLVFRWRVHEGQILLRQRHVRALKTLDLPDPLMAWLLQRLEWAVDSLLGKEEEGVLVLSIDPEKDVAVSLDAVRKKPSLTSEHLVINNGFITGVQYEGVLLEGSVWLERDGVLHASCEELVSAAGTLARDLAQTLGLSVEVCPQRGADTSDASIPAAAIFLISDEFGFVPIRDNSVSTHSSTSTVQSAPATARIEDCFAKLWKA